MKLYVCVKQVPDTETRIKIKGDGASIDTNAIKWVISPYDEYAIEEAIKFKEANPAATVTAVTVGPKSRVNNALLTAMAMGADNSILINCEKSLDALTTAKLLAAAIKQEGQPHLVYTGKLAIDANVSAVGQMLAELIGIPHASVVSKVEYSGDKVTAEREVEGGKKEVFELNLPALIAANKGLNKPRFASLPGIMKAKKKILKTLEASGLGVSIDSPKITFKNFKMPAEKPACKLIDGNPATQAKELARLLREEAKVL